MKNVLYGLLFSCFTAGYEGRILVNSSLFLDHCKHFIVITKQRIEPVLLQYTKIPSYSTEDWTKILNQFPAHLVASTLRFRFSKDQQLHFFGRLLLHESLKAQGYAPGSDFPSFTYDQHGRPTIIGLKRDFNISHSGSISACVLGESAPVGVDVEKVRPMSFTHLKRVMSEHQWQEIHEDPQPMHKFFRYWTIKESVIKTDGRGLQLPLAELEINSQYVQYAHQKWHYKVLDIDPTYCCAVASTAPLDDVLVVEIPSSRLTQIQL